MIFNTNRAIHNLIISIAIILAGIILTLIVNAFMLHSTRENRAKLRPAPIVSDVDKLDPVEFMPVEKAQTVSDDVGNLSGMSKPVYPDAPPPVESKKSNTMLENLLFAMKFYARVPENDELLTSVSGWDSETGYYLPDSGMGASPIIALSRNARYYLVLKLYQKYYPTTHYFDDDAERVGKILDKMISPDNLYSLITGESFYSVQVPDKIYYDLMWLHDLTGETRYRDAAVYIAKQHSDTIIRQSILIKNNRDRSNKIGMFNKAAMGFISGEEMGNLDLQEDSRLVMNELVKELYSDKFNLLFTDSTISDIGNITMTFITNDEMHALTGMVRYAAATGDKNVEGIAHKILESLASGTNPLCDQQRNGFFRRYNGESRSPHMDYKLADDHVTFLDAWVKLNILNDGKYDNILNYHYEFFLNYLYDSNLNAIYFSYELDWRPYKYFNNRPFVSTDAILDYALLSFEDRVFRAQKELSKQNPVVPSDS